MVTRAFKSSADFLFNSASYGANPKIGITSGYNNGSISPEVKSSH